jgi:hypothetical protein
LRVKAALVHQTPVGGSVLFPHDRSVAEPDAEAGPVDLQLLFLGMTLREEGEIVAGSQVLECFRHARDDLHRLSDDLARQRHQLVQVSWRDVAFHKPLVALAEIPCKILRTVAVDTDVRELDFIQDRSNLLGSMDRVIEEVDELIKRLLKVNVVFPKRIVGVNNQVLSQPAVSSEGEW